MNATDNPTTATGNRHLLGDGTFRFDCHSGVACFNLDTFRRFVFESSFLSRFNLPQARLEAVRGNESELLLLGFNWVLRFLAGQGPLREHEAGQ